MARDCILPIENGIKHMFSEECLDEGWWGYLDEPLETAKGGW